MPCFSSSNVGGREQHRLAFARPRAEFVLKRHMRVDEKRRWRALSDCRGCPAWPLPASVSSMVKSGSLAIRAKIQSECSSNGGNTPAALFWRPRFLSSFQLRHHRITELTPTLKIYESPPDATLPLSTASTARSRRVRGIRLGHGYSLLEQINFSTLA